MNNMIYDENALESLLVQVRRIAEHREKGAEQAIKKAYLNLASDLFGWLGNYYTFYADDDDRLDFGLLRGKGVYARFLEEAQQKVDNIYPGLRDTVQDMIDLTYTATWQGMCDAVARNQRADDLHNALKSIKTITPEQVRAAVQNPIPKLRLTPMLEKHRKQIIREIKREIGVGLTNGDRMSTMARRLKRQVEIDYNKSMLIARTEAHRVREKGLDDSAKRIDKIMQDNNSEYRMVKIWHNMRDMAVRHTGRANHVDMEGQTVLTDEKFKLKSGATADCPGTSGVAAEDCNCRCFVEHKLMNDTEFFKATGRHFANKTVDNSDESGIIKIRNADINSRNTGKGKPNAILQFDVELNNRQKKVLEQLNKYDSRVVLRKSGINMSDLAALTAKTGDEFAMLTNSGKRMIIRGNSTSVNIDVEEAKALANQGYKFSGHTHSGIDEFCLFPSDGDRLILEVFNQEESVIYNSKGQYSTFSNNWE